MTTSTAVKAYELLKKDFSEIRRQEYIQEKLSKDAETHMPPGGKDAYISQHQAADSAIHRIITDPRMGEHLNEALAEKEHFAPADRRNLEIMERKKIHRTLSTSLAEAISEKSSEGRMLHREYLESGDDNKMKKHIPEAFALQREAAEEILPALRKFGVTTRYEALVDEYNPDLLQTHIDGLFGGLAAQLPQIIQETVELQRREGEPIPLKGGYSMAAQDRLCRILLTAIGFDFNHGTFDLLPHVHPSCGGDPGDVRLTARYHENTFLPAILAGVHEGGHGIYIQGLPKDWRYQPVGCELGMDVHESQSRIMEIQALLSSETIGWVSEQAILNLGDEPALRPDNLQKIMRRVKPSYIRTEADELTYAMHIVLRTEIESGIIEDTLSANDMPDAWNEKMVRYLGIKPPDNRRGCRQDVHWPTLAIGYFPAYTFGDVGAVLLFLEAVKKHPEIISDMGRGNFTLLKKWGNDNVHSRGSLLTATELFRTVTGQDRNAQAYLNHLSQRYLGRPHAPKP